MLTIDVAVRTLAVYCPIPGQYIDLLTDRGYMHILTYLFRRSHYQGVDVDGAMVPPYVMHCAVYIRCSKLFSEQIDFQREL